MAKKNLHDHRLYLEVLQKADEKLESGLLLDEWLRVELIKREKLDFLQKLQEAEKLILKPLIANEIDELDKIIKDLLE